MTKGDGCSDLHCFHRLTSFHPRDAYTNMQWAAGLTAGPQALAPIGIPVSRNNPSPQRGPSRSAAPALRSPGKLRNAGQSCR